MPFPSRATTIEGIVTIVQESRFQLIDDEGVGHMLVLGALSLAEPAQLEGLARRQARVSVRVKPGAGIIGRVATSITTL